MCAHPWRVVHAGASISSGCRCPIYCSPPVRCARWCQHLVRLCDPLRLLTPWQAVHAGASIWSTYCCPMVCSPLARCARWAQIAEGGDSVPARWAAEHPGEAKPSFNLPCAKLPLPRQDNHCDCGLFLLAYLHYFCAGLPQRMTLSKERPIDHAALEGASPGSRLSGFSACGPGDTGSACWCWKWIRPIDAAHGRLGHRSTCEMQEDVQGLPVVWAHRVHALTMPAAMQTTEELPACRKSVYLASLIPCMRRPVGLPAVPAAGVVPVRQCERAAAAHPRAAAGPLLPAGPYWIP